LAAQRPAGFQNRISKAIERGACSIKYATQKASSYSNDVGALSGLNARSGH
jgi:hypothetical protein